MGNTQLLGYFLDKGERSAAAVQGIGVISNYGVLFQARPTTPCPTSRPCLPRCTIACTCAHHRALAVHPSMSSRRAHMASAVSTPPPLSPQHPPLLCSLRRPATSRSRCPLRYSRHASYPPPCSLHALSARYASTRASGTPGRRPWPSSASSQSPRSSAPPSSTPPPSCPPQSPPSQVLTPSLPAACSACPRPARVSMHARATVLAGTRDSREVSRGTPCSPATA